MTGPAASRSSSPARFVFAPARLVLVGMPGGYTTLDTLDAEGYLCVTMAAWRMTIAVKIFAIAAGLFGLMAVVALLTLDLAPHVGTQLDRLIANYTPGYDDLARAIVRSDEHGL